VLLEIMDINEVKAAAQIYLDACYESDGDKWMCCFAKNGKGKKITAQKRTVI